MTKYELNKRWAELDGMEVSVQGTSILVDGKCLPMPDFTEPNRFFGEVVPRMEELDHWFQFDNVAKTWSASIPVNEGLVHGLGKTIGEAGLEAAIKAREEIGR